jgi:hypothetical protein
VVAIRAYRFRVLELHAAGEQHRLLVALAAWLEPHQAPDFEPSQVAQPCFSVDFDQPSRRLPAELLGGGIDEPVAKFIEVLVQDREACSRAVSAMPHKQVLFLADCRDDVEARHAAAARPALGFAPGKYNCRPRPAVRQPRSDQPDDAGAQSLCRYHY